MDLLIARVGFIFVSEVYHFCKGGFLFYFSQMKFWYSENKVQFYFLQVRIFSLFFANKILFWQVLDLCLEIEVFMFRKRRFLFLQVIVFLCY